MIYATPVLRGAIQHDERPEADVICDIAEALKYSKGKLQGIHTLGGLLSKPADWKGAYIVFSNDALNIHIAAERVEEQGKEKKGAFLSTDARDNCFTLTCDFSLPETLLTSAAGRHIGDVVEGFVPLTNTEYVIETTSSNQTSHLVFKVRAPAIHVN